MLLLFVQPSGYVIPECSSDTSPLTLPARRRFNVEKFMQVAELGKLITANYFIAVNSDLSCNVNAGDYSYFSELCRLSHGFSNFWKLFFGFAPLYVRMGGEWEPKFWEIASVPFNDTNGNALAVHFM